MTRKGFFLIMLLFPGLNMFAWSGSDVPAGVGYYDTLVHLAATDSKVKDYQSTSKIKKKKNYYDSIVDEASERRWAFPIALSYTLEYRRFDDSGCKISSSNAMFGEGTELRDIFLISRLSDDDKLFLQQGNPPNPQIGHLREDQYLALIAPAKIGMSASRHGFDFNLSGMYRMKPFSEKNIFWILGVNFPIKFEVRSMDIHAYDGSLFHHGYAQNVQFRDNAMTLFFKDFSSLEDFFIRAVLGGKGFEFDPNQQKIGFGDISLFSIAEFGPYFTTLGDSFCVSLDALQLGMNVAFPSGSKTTGTKFWEIEFGKGGGYQITFFGSTHFRTEANFLNPMFHAGVEINSNYCASGATGIRMPRTVTHTDSTTRIGEIDEIFTPVFTQYYAREFEEVDSTVAMFSDIAPDATVKVGNRFFFGVGNYFYDVFQTNLRIGVFYNYSSKRPDCFGIEDESFDSSSLSFKSKAHRVGWNLSYQSPQGVEVGFGSQHVFSGTNVPEQHEVFLSLVVSF